MVRRFSGLRVFTTVFVLGGLCLATPVSAQNGDSPYGDRSKTRVHIVPGGPPVRSGTVGGCTWTTRADFADPRTTTGVEGASASLIGSTLYVSHGFRGLDSVFLSAYDTLTNTWTHGGASLPDAVTPRSEMGGGTAGGRHYAIGGRSPTDAVEEFDPVGGAWAARAPLPGGARGGFGVASLGGLIFAVGGRTGTTFGTGTILGTNEVFNPATNSWAPRTPMPVPVSDNYATVGYLGNVYSFGGVDGAGTTVPTVQIYNVATDSWSFGAPMPTARAAAMAGVVGSRIAVYGGVDSVFTSLSITEIYDPATNTWSAGPAMPATANEIAQGMTYGGLRLYSVGTGIFGVAGVVVQELACQPEPSAVPTLDSGGVWILAALLLVAGLILFWRQTAA